jgi:hypothetical protein
MLITRNDEPKEEQEWERLQEAELWCHQQRNKLLQNHANSIFKQKAKTNWKSSYKEAWHIDNDKDIDSFTAMFESFSIEAETTDKFFNKEINFDTRPKCCSHAQKKDAEHWNLISNESDQLNFIYLKGAANRLLKHLGQFSSVRKQTLRMQHKKIPVRTFQVKENPGFTYQALATVQSKWLRSQHSDDTTTKDPTQPYSESLFFSPFSNVHMPGRTIHQSWTDPPNFQRRQTNLHGRF